MLWIALVALRFFIVGWGERKDWRLMWRKTCMWRRVSKDGRAL